MTNLVPSGDAISKELNDLYKQPGPLLQKLENAKNLYREKICKLKQQLLITEQSDIGRLFNSASDFVGEASQYLKDVDHCKPEGSTLETTTRPLYKRLEPQLDKCRLLCQDIKVLQLPQYLTFFQRSIDAAVLIDDAELLNEALNDYLNFLHTGLTLNSNSHTVLCSNVEMSDSLLQPIKSRVKDFEAILEKLNFPIVMAVGQEKPVQCSWTDDNFIEFTKAYRKIVNINISHLNAVIDGPLVSAHPSLPMQIILSCLEKRFRYHFCTDRKTSRLDKPEWYISQVLQWINCNKYILTTVYRDFVVKQDPKLKPLFMDFMQGLVALLMDKLGHDLGFTSTVKPRYTVRLQLLKVSEKTPRGFDEQTDSDVSPGFHSTLFHSNAKLFGHLIDVLLAAESQLARHGLTSFIQGFDDEPIRLPTSLLCRTEPLSEWIKLEYQLVSNRLTTLMANSDCWQTLTTSQSHSDVDGRCRPGCTDELLALFHAIGLRGRHLQLTSARLRFLRIQLGILSQFLDLCKSLSSSNVTSGASAFQRSTSPDRSKDIVDNIHHSSGTGMLDSVLNWFVSKPNEANEDRPLSPTLDDFYTKSSSSVPSWCSIVNALQCIRDSMRDFAANSYYLSFWEDASIRASLEHPDPLIVDLGLEQDLNDRLMHLYQVEIDRRLASNLTSQLDRLTQAGSSYLAPNSDAWLRPRSPLYDVDHSSTLQVSGLASDLLTGTRDLLTHLSRQLHPALFETAWQLIARHLDGLIYNKLIQSNRFSASGVEQLRFDLTKCLFALFSPYTTSTDRAVDAYFPQSRDALILLSLAPKSTGSTLKASLKRAMSSSSNRHDNNDKVTSPITPLVELGVYTLTPEEALVVLALRDAV